MQKILTRGCDEFFIDAQGIQRGAEHCLVPINPAEVDSAEIFIRTFAHKQITPNLRASSYGLKHRAEAFMAALTDMGLAVPATYISNGAFISAASRCNIGIKYPKYYDGLNCYFYAKFYDNAITWRA